jgi:hypothetical protein
MCFTLICFFTGHDRLFHPGQQRKGLSLFFLEARGRARTLLVERGCRKSRLFFSEVFAHDEKSKRTKICSAIFGPFGFLLLDILRVHIFLIHDWGLWMGISHLLMRYDASDFAPDTLFTQFSFVRGRAWALVAGDGRF